MTPGGRRLKLFRQSALLTSLLLGSAVVVGATDTEVRRIAPQQFPEIRTDPVPRSTRSPAEPSLERPLADCTPDRSNWIFCLQTAARASDTRLEATVDDVARQLARSEVFSPYQRQSFERAVREADRRFRALRDYECQTLALSEPEAWSELFEARLTCRIRRNLERIATLTDRYRLPR